ncbi:CaiB/BaiF CoA transferase family protein [Pseudonocardia sp. RS010]|uniref:CaiB/BaiF CoA transferase family protein n=1 Tax=Pseudonocardia sp. RS010 TaxID=3385979 RepID=UPI0039A291EA
MSSDPDPTAFLAGVRVVEIADELGEYCGKVLAGLGADVVKVEPPGGEATRRIGPFVRDEPHPERSLFFWHYNLGKRSVELDLDTEEGAGALRELVASADIVLDTYHRDYLRSRGVGAADLIERHPGLITLRISPFGDDGPWADHRGSDLVHLALGGVMMNCGYDPAPDGTYDTPPIAPQMWHAYHITGEMAVMSILAALNHRRRTGEGQHIAVAVHDAVSKNSETDTPDWVFLRQEHFRITCRHSTTPEGAAFTSVSSLARTKDGRWLLPYRAYAGLKGFVNAWEGSRRILARYGMAMDLESPEYDDPIFRGRPEVTQHIADCVDDLVERLPFAADLWREAQAEGMPWAPVRKPEENLDDEHWLARETFAEVHHPELGETFIYVGAKWLAPGVPWRVGPRPPLVGEHTDEVRAEWAGRGPGIPTPTMRPTGAVTTSARGKPFALQGVRVVDLSWMLASAGAGRFLAAFGADVIKVEHESRWDGMRFSTGLAPDGGRAARDAATGPLPTPQTSDPNRGGSFMEINSGKRGMSLNLKDPQGQAILTELLRDADVVVEGFSPGTMERMGFGYDRLREINPRIVYIQQSGLGQRGTYGGARTYGPTAQALIGLSDMSGLPEPYAPAGIGYSYLDWFGAYNMANAILAALYRRDATGQGCYVDCAQAEVGAFLTGTAVLDHTVNGRTWSRYGNRSPYKQAAPHGAYRTAGDDRWIAVACFDDVQWRALAEELGTPAWTADERYATLAGRLADQERLDRLVEGATRDRDPFELMARLQARGVPAGVCQTAQDRYERDPQLAHLGWTVELEQRTIGRWPVKEHPGLLGATPAYMGGPHDRSGPDYGQDTVAVLRDVLGYDADTITRLQENGVV